MIQALLNAHLICDDSHLKTLVLNLINSGNEVNQLERLHELLMLLMRISNPLGTREELCDKCAVRIIDVICKSTASYQNPKMQNIINGIALLKVGAIDEQVCNIMNDILEKEIKREKENKSPLIPPFILAYLIKTWILKTKDDQEIHAHNLFLRRCFQSKNGLPQSVICDVLFLLSSQDHYVQKFAARVVRDLSVQGLLNVDDEFLPQREKDFLLIFSSKNFKISSINGGMQFPWFMKKRLIKTHGDFLTRIIAFFSPQKPCDQWHMLKMMTDHVIKAGLIKVCSEEVFPGAFLSFLRSTESIVQYQAACAIAELARKGLIKNDDEILPQLLEPLRALRSSSNVCVQWDATCALDALKQKGLIKAYGEEVFPRALLPFLRSTESYVQSWVVDTITELAKKGLIKNDDEILPQLLAALLARRSSSSANVRRNVAKALDALKQINVDGAGGRRRFLD